MQNNQPASFLEYARRKQPAQPFPPINVPSERKPEPVLPADGSEC